MNSLEQRYESLQIIRVRRGGYEVIRPDWADTHQLNGMTRQLVLCACSTLDEAITFIRENIMENARFGDPEWMSGFKAVGPQLVHTGDAMYIKEMPLKPRTKPGRARKAK